MRALLGGGSQHCRQRGRPAREPGSPLQGYRPGAFGTDHTQLRSKVETGKGAGVSFARETEAVYLPLNRGRPLFRPPYTLNPKS